MNPITPPEIPLISVIIPVYNGEKYIGATIGSVLSQTEQRFEIIAVNDGSSDRSLHVLEEIQKDHPKQLVILSGANKGVSRARNSGVCAARGKYLAFIDQDDLWARQKLEEQLRIHEQDPVPKISFTNEAIIDETGRVIHKSVLRLDEKNRGNIFEELLFDNFIPLSSVMLPKTLFLQAGGFDPTYTLAEDFDFLLRAAQNSLVEYVPASLLFYREHPGSNTYSKIDCIMQESFAILLHWKEKRPDLFRKYRFRYFVFRMKFYGLRFKILIKRELLFPQG
jgi:glycosyltransferase involved in cell wall biosynthesis